MKGPHPIFFVGLGLFGLYCIEFGVVGILPLIMERFHVTATRAGLLVGLFALVVAVGGPPLVLLASRVNRKRMLAGALLFFAAISVWSAYAPGFESLLALRLLAALLHPVYFSLAMVAAIAMYPPGQAARASAHAFVGTSMGMVLGIPLTTWIAAAFSYETSFFFCAAANGIAALGLMIWLPQAPAGAQLSYGKQLGILRKPVLWLNIAAATMVFAAMFSVYAYAAEHLRHIGMDGKAISVMLLVFGLGGLLGNLLAGHLLGKRLVLTVLLQPLLLAFAYVILHLFATPAAMTGLVVIMLFWGAAHTSGLVVTQVWLSSAAPEAPEFATGLYIAFINLGVTIGAVVGGSFIASSGMRGSIASGLTFALLAAALVAFKTLLYDDASRRRIGSGMALLKSGK
ncbi:MFS transporter [Pseudoduganella violacea]|uniref:Putative MFS family arabinose efflux permease n=1 Tax=Pseudoduganella violacea TaxID=1715466 RepID=A0A7W5FT42_9BURK|nr:MFS transporter [Pseudoduganella violacea]MBB3118459.1 putative MFS family arabinose efflux permease [Pseudoduganella violacea]